MQTCILLATYNGGAYLAELLASIQAQSVQSWQLLVRDDGSTDATREILTAAAANDARIAVVNDAKTRLGAAQNFAALMNEARAREARYVAFADQDDVWDDHKLSRQLERIRQAESCAGESVPLLVHSDLSVVDERLRTTAVSLARYARLPPSVADPLARLLVYNHVTGCAMLINRRLLDLALPVPSTAFMHDWWLALIAASCGRIEYEPTPTVFYRQHGQNAIGARTLWQKLDPRRDGIRSEWRRAMQNFHRSVLQTKALAEHLGERRRLCRMGAVELVEAYLAALADSRSAWGRWRRVRRLGIGGLGWFRDATLAVRVMAWRGECPVSEPSPARRAA